MAGFPLRFSRRVYYLKGRGDRSDWDVGHGEIVYHHRIVALRGPFPEPGRSFREW